MTERRTHFEPHWLGLTFDGDWLATYRPESLTKRGRRS